MKHNKFCFAALAVALSIGCLYAPASAVDVPAEEISIATFGVTRASDSFHITIQAKQQAHSTQSFHLTAGETVRFNASYTPDGSVDFGLIDPDGNFRYFNVTSGKIDKTMKVEKNGSYTLQIRNNSSKEIKVSGYVNY